MLRKTLTAAAFGAAFLPASMALAGEMHEVTILDNDFMPPLVYAQPGDKIRFVNDDEGIHKVLAEDESWESPILLPNTYYEIVVTPAMDLNYELDEDLFVELEIEGGGNEGTVEGNSGNDSGTSNDSEGEVTFEELELNNG
ncbi:hypothetical protein IV417_01400 [Alphaproteobacteria bacterium KMM 3653]|uniref:Plastocyanin n=1 Tax=Harenicola maris TaxID=2841044 RepID=A0AAP2CKD0_9RHOB|nr:hypothetical protein [Harenicola maris]